MLADEEAHIYLVASQVLKEMEGGSKEKFSRSMVVEGRNAQHHDKEQENL